MEDVKGVDVGGVNVISLGCADDVVLLAVGPMFLQALLAALNGKGGPYGMNLHDVYE